MLYPSVLLIDFVQLEDNSLNIRKKNPFSKHKA